MARILIKQRKTNKIRSKAKILFSKLSENRLAWIIIAFFTIAYLVFELVSYHNFRFPVLDLGLYNRHFWGMSNFDFGANPLKGYNLLGDHSHFVLLLLVPFYAIFRDPQTLLVIQTLAITLSGYPIYLIAKKYFVDKTVAALWLLPYFFFLGFSSALDYPFHVSPLAVLPMAWAFYYLIEKNYKPLFVSLALLLFIKEDMPLVVIMFALYMIFFYRRYLWGTITLLLSGIYFVFVTKYWLPHISQIVYYYSDAGELGANWNEVFLNAVKNPALLIHNLFLPSIKYQSMIYLLASFGGFSLAAPEIIIFLSPIWLGRFLNTQPWRWTLTQHYSANQAPILIVAAIIGVYRISMWLKPKVKPSLFHKIALSFLLLS